MTSQQNFFRTWRWSIFETKQAQQVIIISKKKISCGKHNSIANSCISNNFCLHWAIQFSSKCVHMLKFLMSSPAKSCNKQLLLSLPQTGVQWPEDTHLLRKEMNMVLERDLRYMCLKIYSVTQTLKTLLSIATMAPRPATIPITWHLPAMNMPAIIMVLIILSSNSSAASCHAEHLSPLAAAHSVIDVSSCTILVL